MKRILFAIPIPYDTDGGFWTRDSGLVVLALRKMGYVAWLVALGDASTVTSDGPIQATSLETMQSAAWWQSQRPDAVVLNTWSAPRYDAIRKAALSATPRVVERLDTDGIRSARLYPLSYFQRFWSRGVDVLPAYARWLAPFPAAARTALLYTFPGLMDTRMVATMSQLPAVMAESPIAVARIQKMFETFSDKKQRVAMIPHPVNEQILHYDGSAKENRIITVGSWATAQKDFPMLRKVLKGFLQRHPNWQAIASISRQRMGAGTVAQATLALLEEISRNDARSDRERGALTSAALSSQPFDSGLLLSWVHLDLFRLAFAYPFLFEFLVSIFRQSQSTNQKRFMVKPLWLAKLNYPMFF